MLTHKPEYMLNHSHETAIKLEIVDCDLTSLKCCVDSLLRKDNILNYLYSEYVDNDWADVTKQIEFFVEHLAFVQSNTKEKKHE